MSFDLNSRAELVKKFPFNNDSDIFVVDIGYNDLEHIKPIKWVHRKRNYSIHYVFEGSGKLFIDNNEFHVEKKQLFFISTDEDVMYYPDEDNKWKYIWFSFNGNQAEQIGKSMGFCEGTSVLPLKEHKKAEYILLELLSDAEKGKINEYKAKAAFFSIVGAMSANATTEQITKNCADEAANFLETNFMRSDLSVEAICSLLYVSHSSLCKVFKNEYGVTPLRYLIQIRMQYASKLLLEGDMQIKRIAELSGYSDEVHFMKTFKKYYDATPTEYREKFKRKAKKS
ncbi:MAG: AraC family transcriptional regulator [Clostridia bacterium]|nr:AraC family transcriptional regulator [Clostridia bacterium]MBR6603985.1 AraC family transcriptional regulator [Clostridia bacterium]